VNTSEEAAKAKDLLEGRNLCLRNSLLVVLKICMEPG
jgi:hypothetical protein